MIKLKDTQEIKISQIDAVCASLNEMHADSLALVNAGMQAIHAAIVAKL